MFNKDTLNSQISYFRKSGYTVPREPKLNPTETEHVLDVLNTELKLPNRETVLIILTLLFQKGGTARQCQGSMQTTWNDTKVTLASVRAAMKKAGHKGQERKLARSLATSIHHVAELMDYIPGNLAKAVQSQNLDFKLTNEDLTWLSDFQVGNDDCPEKLQKLMLNHFKNINFSRAKLNKQFRN